MLSVSGSVLGLVADMIHAIVEFLNLFFAGVLAGEELVICYGVRTVVAVLDQQAQIQLRHALIRKLRALVPAIFILTALSGTAAMSLDETEPGFRLRCLAALGLLIWVVSTLFGTFPIGCGNAMNRKRHHRGAVNLAHLRRKEFFDFPEILE
jgi:hypothetical protein